MWVAHQRKFENVTFDNGSFKDPSGRVFYLHGHVYRLINEDTFNFLNDFFKSEAFQNLKKSIVETEIVESPTDIPQFNGKILKHKKINGLTFCYEWTPDQFKSAALLTLDLQIQLLKNDMMLKDATPFNVLFENAHPIFIDLPSIVKYQDGGGWPAFNEFLENFFYPLLTYHHFGIDIGKLTLGHLGRMTLEEAYPLLKSKSIFNWTIWKYIRIPHYLKGKVVASKNLNKIETKTIIPKEIVLNNCKELKKTILELNFKAPKGHWEDYTQDRTYTSEDRNIKEEFIHSCLKNKPILKLGIDVGANTGEFSKVLSKYVEHVIAVESNINCCNEIYKNSLIDNLNISTCLMDFSQPTPSLGWANTERPSFLERYGKTDVILALAVIHHLRFSSNVPLDFIISLFAKISNKIIIEWVPLEDPMVKKLLERKENTYFDYTEDNFLKIFNSHFKPIHEIKLPQGRKLFYGEKY